MSLTSKKKNVIALFCFVTKRLKNREQMQQDKSGNDTKRIEWRKSFGIKRVQHRQSYTWRYNQLRGRSKITCLAYDAENELLRTEPLGVRFNSPLSPSSQSRHSAVPSPRRLGRPFFFFFFSRHWRKSLKNKTKYIAEIPGIKRVTARHAVKLWEVFS